MTSEEPYGQEGLTQNDFVENVLADPSQLEDPAVVYQGFLGRSLREGYSRLYLTDALDYCIEYKQCDIKDYVSIPKEQSDLGLDSTKVWIKLDATIELIFRTRPSEASDILANSPEARRRRPGAHRGG